MRRALAVGAVAALSACGPAGPWVGVNVTGPPDHRAARAADVGAVADAGAGWVRIFVPWNAADRGPGRYDWSDVDAQVGAARRRGLRVLGTVTGTAHWARPAGTGPNTYPSDPATYGRAVVDAQRRFRFDAIQPSNEPDLLSHADDIRPEAYAPVLRAAVWSLRAAAITTPVVFASLSPLDRGDYAYGQREFLARSLELGLGGLVDGYGLNVYSLPDSFSTSYAPTRLGRIRGIVDAYDSPLKLVWLTEYGSPAGRCDGCLTEGAQALQLADYFRTVDALRGPWRLGPAFWFGTSRWGPSSDWNGNLNLIRDDRSWRPALDVLRQVATS